MTVTVLPGTLDCPWEINYREELLLFSPDTLSLPLGLLSPFARR